MGPQGVYKFSALLSNSENFRPPIKMKDGTKQQLYSKQTFAQGDNTDSVSSVTSQSIMESVSLTSLQSILTSAKLVTSSTNSVTSHTRVTEAFVTAPSLMTSSHYSMTSHTSERPLPQSTVTSSSVNETRVSAACVPSSTVSSAASPLEPYVPTEGDYSNVTDEMIMVKHSILFYLLGEGVTEVFGFWHYRLCLHMY